MIITENGIEYVVSDNYPTPPYVKRINVPSSEKRVMFQWDFIKKFTLEEWAAFKTMKKTDVTAEILDDFLMARPEVDLDDEIVTTGMAYLVTKGIITQEKADSILGA